MSPALATTKAPSQMLTMVAPFAAWSVIHARSVASVLRVTAGTIT
jgi:hypothetical protein